jgi:hypothetical protein
MVTPSRFMVRVQFNRSMQRDEGFVKLGQAIYLSKVHGLRFTPHGSFILPSPPLSKQSLTWLLAIALTDLIFPPLAGIIASQLFHK